ncbi:hypothetical protein [Aerosakkonema funiforme]|uniref:hypothetical protein n=1 Tax=Aerosakkonema funiforme TaxID=1246630 RepID=UPI0035B7C27F
MEAQILTTQTIEFNELHPSEQQQRVQLEAKIRQHQQAFDEVGNALIALRDKRLYRSTHDTFERYCQEQWDMTSRRANQLIKAAEVIQNLKANNNGNNCSQMLPANEAQIRYLTSLTPEQQCEVWQKAVEKSPNGKPTASLVKEMTELYNSGSSRKVVLSAPSKKIYEAISVLAKYEIGQIREAVFSFQGEQLGLPKLAGKVADSFSLLELNPSPVIAGSFDS